MSKTSTANAKKVVLACDAVRAVNLDLSGDPALEVVYVFWWNEQNNVTESIDLSNCAGLKIVNIEGLTGLDFLMVDNNPLLATVDISGCPALLNLYCRIGALPEAVVDSLLNTLDVGGLSNGYCLLNGGTNAPPSAGGLAAKANLEARGWTVEVNS